MLTEAVIRAVDYVGVPERRRLATADGKPLPDAARIDPRGSVAFVLVAYSLLMMVLGVLGIVLISTGASKTAVGAGFELSAIRFAAAGAVIQGIRAAVIFPLLRGVRSGKWQPSKRWHEDLAYPRDSDFILQALVVVAFLLK